MKTVKGGLFKKYLERRKSWAPFCLPLVWLPTVIKKIIENCNFVGAGAQKIGEVVSFWTTLTIILPIFGESKKGKLHILKKAGLSSFSDTL